MDTLNILYLVGAVLIFASIMASTLSARLGVPLLLLFLKLHETYKERNHFLGGIHRSSCIFNIQSE